MGYMDFLKLGIWFESYFYLKKKYLKKSLMEKMCFFGCFG